MYETFLWFGVSHRGASTWGCVCECKRRGGLCLHLQPSEMVSMSDLGDYLGIGEEEEPSEQTVTSPSVMGGRFNCDCLSATDFMSRCSLANFYIAPQELAC